MLMDNPIRLKNHFYDIEYSVLSTTPRVLLKDPAVWFVVSGNREVLQREANSD